MAIASFVLSILGVVTILNHQGLSFVFSLLGLIFGAIVLRSDKHRYDRFRKFGKAGMIISIVALSIVVFLFFLLLIGVFSIAFISI